MFTSASGAPDECLRMVTVKNITIKTRDRWQYVGSDGSAHLAHTVISVTGNEVVTWSDSRPGECGWSWMGPGVEFIKNFVRVPIK